MFVSDNLNVNSLGRLTIGKNDTVELAKEFGLEVFQVPNTSEKVKPEDFDGKLVKKGV